MPVPSGYGVPTLDYLLCVNGQFLAIEAKAPGKKPTPRQLASIQEITAAGGTVIVIDGDLSELNAFLNTYTQRKPAYKPTPEQQRRTRLKYRHGITPEEYDALISRQFGHCFFCSRTPDVEPHGVLCVDHDHATGRVRGLVCRVHNRALANFGDDIEGFERALSYVRGNGNTTT